MEAFLGKIYRSASFFRITVQKTTGTLPVLMCLYSPFLNMMQRKTVLIRVMKCLTFTVTKTLNQVM